MAISAVANSGPQPPSLASLLQINRINPITGKDADDAKGVSGATLPKAGAKPSVIPRLAQDVLKTLSQLGANPLATQAEGSGAQAQDIKKTAVDFLTSVISALKPQADNSYAKVVNPLEQLNTGISQMISAVGNGSSIDTAVAQSADKLLKSAGVPSNSNTLGGLLEGLQRSLLDDSGVGSLINVTA